MLRGCGKVFTERETNAQYQYVQQSLTFSKSIKRNMQAFGYNYTT